MTGLERRQSISRVLQVSSGNFLEMYDFIVYSYYATYIAHTFFPAASEFASLMLSLMTFGAGYLMRPLGAIVLGSWMDRKGRRSGLILTLGLMALGTLAIAATPGYVTLGLLAPALIVAGRLLQGFSAGVELGGVSVYLAEIATPGHRGFYCSWQSGSQQVAVVFTALVGVALVTMVPSAQMSAWGWRVPFYIGCLMIPVLFWIRRTLPETEAFKQGKHTQSIAQIVRVLGANWPVVLVGMMLSILTTTTFYLITAYTPTYGKQALHLDPAGNLMVTLCAGLSNLFWLPVGGALSDRIGRRTPLILIPVLALLMAYPAMLWLVRSPGFARLLTVELLFSFFFGIYNGAMIPLLFEIMPREVRTAGFSLAFSLATAVFGGFTPAVCTWLIRTTGNAAAPGLWLSLAAAISLVAAFASKGLPEYRDREI